MSKRLLSYIVVGALCLVFFELVLEGIQFTNPPDWFRPIWIVLSVIFQLVAFPAHLTFDYLTMLLDLPLLVKPTFVEMGSLRVSLLLGADAIEGALLGWLLFIAKKRIKSGH